MKARNKKRIASAFGVAFAGSLVLYTTLLQKTLTVVSGPFSLERMFVAHTAGIQAVAFNSAGINDEWLD